MSSAETSTWRPRTAKIKQTKTPTMTPNATWIAWPLRNDRMPAALKGSVGR